MPCLNASATLPRLLESLKSQTLSSDAYEIIVVDDGSDDGSQTIAARFGNVVLLTQEQQGPGAARNRGTRAARGNYVLYLDSDLHVHEHLLSTHLEFHRQHAHVSATGGSVLPNGEPAIFSWILVDHLCSWFNSHPAARYRGEPEYLPSLNFCINKKRVFEENRIEWVSGLNCTGEDVVFCSEMRRHGLPIAFLPNAVVYHHDRETMKGYLRHMYRWGNHAPYVRGRLPNAEYAFLFPDHPLLLCLMIPFIIAGYSLLIWKCWLSARPLKTTLALPQIVLGRISYAWGVVVGTLQKRKEKS